MISYAIPRRIHALSILNQLKNNLSDIADRLNSGKKRLAYLFLFEYWIRSAGSWYRRVCA